MIFLIVFATSCLITQVDGFTKLVSSLDLSAILKRLEYLEMRDSDRGVLEQKVANLESELSKLKGENQLNTKRLNGQVSFIKARFQKQVTSLQKQLRESQARFETVIAELSKDLSVSRSENEKLQRDMSLIKEKLENEQNTNEVDDLYESQNPVTSSDDLEDKSYDGTQDHHKEDNQPQGEKDAELPSNQRHLIESKSYRQRRGHTQQRILRGEGDLNVAFYATIGNHHVTHAGVNQALVFDNVITNVGKAYNQYAGDFRAPVAGTYVFSVSLQSYSGHSAHYQIVKNNTGVGNIYLHGASGMDSSGMTVALQLNQGDMVVVRGTDADEYLHGYLYSAFSGFLLSQDYSSPAIVG